MSSIFDDLGAINRRAKEIVEQEAAARGVAPDHAMAGKSFKIKSIFDDEDDGQINVPDPIPVVAHNTLSVTTTRTEYAIPASMAQYHRFIKEFYSSYLAMEQDKIDRHLPQPQLHAHVSSAVSRAISTMRRVITQVDGHDTSKLRYSSSTIKLMGDHATIGVSMDSHRSRVFDRATVYLYFA